MAFYHVPRAFLLVILCALTMLSLHSHGAHNSCTALHGVDIVLTTSQRTSYNQRANAMPQHPYWRCQCVALVMLEIVLCAPQHSAFFLDTLGLQ